MESHWEGRYPLCTKHYSTWRVWKFRGGPSAIRLKAAVAAAEKLMERRWQRAEAAAVAEEAQEVIDLTCDDVTQKRQSKPKAQGQAKVEVVVISDSD